MPLVYRMEVLQRVVLEYNALDQSTGWRLLGTIGWEGL